MYSASRKPPVRACPAAAVRTPLAAPSKVGLTVAAVLAGAAGVATAHADAAAPAARAASVDTLQEVVVTARKRQENLQDVPISIDVFSKQELRNLAISTMDDYLQKVPSISYISTGPGTQLFVMRGVSDGSNPNYSNTSSTGFFVDDMSMNYGGSQPDLHLYDIERIEILNGPQGTTFGAEAMSGAIRYITNKPDLRTLSGGIDFDGGQIQSAQQNWTYQGFLNVPLIAGVLALRVSAFSDSEGGFIDNALTTRAWVNGAVSTNAPWAGKDYNRENVEGGRVALKWQIAEQWSALLTYGLQRQRARGAWDEDPTLPPRTVSRFGPESNLFETNMFDFHVEGDVGIADLVLASTYWSQERRQWDEYSQYEQNYNGGTQEGFTCLTDPYYSPLRGSSATTFSGCNPAVQYYSYNENPKRWSNELRLVSKEGGRLHWLAGLYWEKTVDRNYGSTFYMPGLQYGGDAFQYELQYYGLTQRTLPPGVWYTYSETSDVLETTEFANINFDVTEKLNVEAGVSHFHDNESYDTPVLGFAYSPNSPSYYSSTSHKWDGKAGVSYKLSPKAMLYADWSQGFRPGGSNSGLPADCYASGVTRTYDADTLNNYELGWKTTSLGHRLLWNGAAYYMDWKNLQALIYDASVCASSSYNINVGEAHIYGAESNVDYVINDNWSLQASLDYTDARVVAASAASYDAYVGERLPFSPYFNWSWNARYEHPVSRTLRGYLQLDMSHKGGMYNGLNPDDKNTGLPRILQPPYTIVNLRVGMHPADSERWLVELYCTNLTDKNAIVYSNTGNFDLRETTNEPRVFGVRLSYRFNRPAQ
ncbi:MAG TPA: TonB-dependent receptor [Steroidobacteraceae bacterium]|nr:TonB-dependent receptor [Steroidobacteraceae bacterium]